MKRILDISLFCFLTQVTIAQTWKFDLGSGPVAKGYTKVTPETKFNYATGFGFDQGSGVSSVQRKGKDALTCDFITGDKPFYFSVKLPEGNYDVKLILGDKEGISATTVRAECRRLFLQNVQTKKGEIVEKTFTSPDGKSIKRKVELFTWEKLDAVKDVKKAFGLK